MLISSAIFVAEESEQYRQYRQYRRDAYPCPATTRPNLVFLRSLPDVAEWYDLKLKIC